MIVAICKLDIVLKGHRSLKEKRQVIRKIKDSIFGKFKIPVAEVGHNDLWQRTEIGFSIVGNSQQKINSIMDKIIDCIYEMVAGHIVDKKSEFIHFK